MTKIYVVIEQHFVEYQGAIYTDIAFAYPYWQEYLEVFGKVCPVARVRKLTTLLEGWQRADGPNVCFIPINLKERNALPVAKELIAYSKKPLSSSLQEQKAP